MKKQQEIVNAIRYCESTVNKIIEKLYFCPLFESCHLNGGLANRKDQLDFFFSIICTFKFLVFKQTKRKWGSKAPPPIQ